MLEFIVCNNITGEYENQIWELLKKIDKEFIPPLSARKSTHQKEWNTPDTEGGEPVEYFRQMKEQKIILALEKDKVRGFLTYISDFKLEIGNEKMISEYVSTIGVDPAYRKKGIAQSLYKKLIENSPGKRITTRTWSLNKSHLHILEEMGFELLVTIKNDRGRGIDTVYYTRRIK